MLSKRGEKKVRVVSMLVLGVTAGALIVGGKPSQAIVVALVVMLFVQIFAPPE